MAAFAARHDTAALARNVGGNAEPCSRADDDHRGPWLRRAAADHAQVTCCKKRQGPRHGFKIVDDVAAGKSKARAKLCRVDYPRVVGERAAPVLDYAGNAKEGIADCGVVRLQRHENGKPVGEILIVIDRHVRDGAEPGAVKHSKAYIGAAHIGQQNGVRTRSPSVTSPPICTASTADRDRSRVRRA